MKVAIVGATGVVGKVMLDVLEERKFPITELIPVASKKSVGRSVNFLEKNYSIVALEELFSKKIDLAFFSAGSDISKVWAPKLAEKGTRVIDNSSYWRMCSKHKLIVPEINGNLLEHNDMIIANPNCSTIQLLVVLAPLHRKLTIERVIVSTYQAVSGSGHMAITQLEKEKNNEECKRIYPHSINENVIPHCDEFQENLYTREEMKLVLETKKILDNKIKLSATAVRIPINRGHSESVNVTFSQSFNVSEIYENLNEAKGVMVLDSPFQNQYPMPDYSKGKDEVFVGRIRRDFSHPNALNLWIVADNLRKGAATNAIQIAEEMIRKKIL